MIIKTVEYTEDGKEVVTLFEQSDVTIESMEYMEDETSEPKSGISIFLKDFGYVVIHPGSRVCAAYIMNDKGKTVEVYRNH